MINALTQHWQDYLLEAAGLIFFMLAAGALGTLFLYPGSVVAQAVPSQLGKHAGLGLCMGLVTFLIVSVIGGRSGAHINPAVTWSFWRAGKIHTWDALFYTVAQFAGACLAPIVLVAAIGTPFAHDEVRYGMSLPGPGGEAVAFAAEFGIAFVLMLVLLVTVNSRRLAKHAPAIIAALIALYITFESPLSGMSLNPARSFGSALIGGHWEGLWLYFVAPVAGMFLAVEVHKLLRVAQQRLVTKDYVPGPHYPVAQGA